MFKMHLITHIKRKTSLFNNGDVIKIQNQKTFCNQIESIFKS